MKKLLTITFLGSVLFISLIMNVALFIFNETNKRQAHNLEGQVGQLETGSHVCRQQLTMCEQVIQDCDLSEEGSSRLFVWQENEENNFPESLTALSPWLD